jgi:very-short-patch-repair endonuclease
MSTDGSFSRDVPGDLPAGLAPGSPFRGSAARAAGLVSAGVLRGPRFRRLYPDVYLASDVEVTLALRARGAYLLVVGRGAVGGFAAAELLGASCGPEDAPVDLVVPGRAYRTHPGLTIHRGLLVPDEITTVDIVPVNIGAGRGPVPRSGPVEHVVVTAARRTAYDLACRLPLVDAVVAVDALANAHRFEPAAIGGLRQRHLGARGSAHLTEVIRLANRLSDSPMETRIRLVIVFDGLPVPVLQHPVGPYFLDMAYPAIRLAVEYDGQAHRSQQRALRDLTRQAYLSSRGWKILRFTAVQVLRRPWEVAAEVRSELIRAARRHGVGLDQVHLY